jgi:hypothetical protein
VDASVGGASRVVTCLNARKAVVLGESWCVGRGALLAGAARRTRPPTCHGCALRAAQGRGSRHAHASRKAGVGDGKVSHHATERLARRRSG